jgi:hypothetical protein
MTFGIGNSKLQSTPAAVKTQLDFLNQSMSSSKADYDVVLGECEYRRMQNWRTGYCLILEQNFSRTE